MREILFRGKRVDNGEWIYGYLIQLELVDETMSNIFNSDVDIDMKRLKVSVQQQLEQVITETVGQFTGLTDKNGTKIFEGDIVTNFANVFKSVVQWNNVGFAPFSNDKTSFFADECEVIGNIHENGVTE